MAHRLATGALAAVDPERLVREALRGEGGSWGAMLAIGKAAAAMARGAREAAAPGTARLLVRPHSAPALLDVEWRQLSGGHPLPDRQSLAAGEAALAWLRALPGELPLLALVSGGSSACIEAVAEGISLEDLIATQRILLGSGVAIDGFNAVRKHLSIFKGGGGLRACRCQVVALLLSDVPGDDPGTIGSGPFAADPTTFATARAAVAGWELPPVVASRLAAGERGEVPETLKPGDPELARVETRVIGANGTAVAAAANEARRLGMAVTTAPLTGEAAEAARLLVARGRAAPGPRVAIVAGGETTVTLGAGAGRGGRNQELALAAARELAGGSGELVLTLATDGEDGPTSAAGGVVDGSTGEIIARAGVDPLVALRDHDSLGALTAAPGALLETGRTGTNVSDLAFYLRWVG
jgi:glycerate 2-kinase